MQSALLSKKLDGRLIEEEYARLKAWLPQAALNSQSRRTKPGSFNLDEQQRSTGLGHLQVEYLIRWKLCEGHHKLGIAPGTVSCST